MHMETHDNQQKQKEKRPGTHITRMKTQREHMKAYENANESQFNTNKNLSKSNTKTTVVPTNALPWPSPRGNAQLFGRGG